MNFNGNFHKIGTIDVGHFKRLVASLPPQAWLDDTERQTKYEVHRQTQTIGLVYDYDFRHTKPTVRQPFKYFESALIPAVKYVAQHYDQTAEGSALATQSGPGYCVRANLVRLNPGGSIDPHQDKNFSLAHSHRIHIPLITNPRVEIVVHNERRYLAEGEVVEINNRRMHSVSNDSDVARVHLLLDWIIAGQQCCCANKVHPGQSCNPEICMPTDRMNTPCVCFEP